MPVIFDVDGVLVDSRSAVTQSYADAGVEMPEDAWGKPWTAWLVEATGSIRSATLAHQAKNLAYPENLIKYGKVLYPTELAHELIFRGYEVLICTGASNEALKRVLEFTLLEDVKVIGTNMTQLGKCKKIISLAYDYTRNKGEPTIVIDDDITVVGGVRDEKTNTKRQLDSILYTPEIDDILKQEVLDKWTRLSSQRVETSG